MSGFQAKGNPMSEPLLFTPYKLGDITLANRVVMAPLTRSRFPTFVPKVLCRSTPGEDIDVVVTQYGLTVNPRNGALRDRFKSAGLKLVDMEELLVMAEKATGKPAPLRHGDRIVAEIIHRDGRVLDRIPQLRAS